MPNPIKYTTGSETNALKKGNFYIGTGDVGKGPSDTTGYYQGVSPSSGGYVIYMNKSGAPGDLSYHNAPTDAELISFTNNLAGQSYTTVNECLVYFAGQTDKMVLNRDYEGIVTDGLVFNVDGGFTPSYPKNGNTIYDISTSTNDGTLTNGPTFSDGSIVFDGVDDFITFPSSSDFNFSSNDFSFECFVFFDSSTSSDNTYRNIFTIGNNSNSSSSWMTLTKWRSGLGNGVVLDYAYNGGRYVITTSTEIPSPNVRNTVSSPLYNVNNKWTHFIATMNSNTLTLYINGTSVGDVTVDNKWNTTMIAKIGLDGYSSYMKGKIPIVRLYKNKALTSDEVLQNFNAQKGRFGL